MQDLMTWLQDLLADLADGDWEHREGIRIVSLDNPGWSVRIELEGTKFEGLTFADVSRDGSENDWFTCRLRDRAFHGYGGPHNLGDILGIFRSWSETIRAQDLA